MYRCVFPLGTQCDPLPREALKPLVNRISIQRFLRSLDYDFGLLCFTHESTDFSPPGSRAGRCRANGHHRSSLYFSTTFHINLYIAKGHSTAECKRFLKGKKIRLAGAENRRFVCAALCLQEFVPCMSTSTFSRGGCRGFPWSASNEDTMDFL